MNTKIKVRKATPKDTESIIQFNIAMAMETENKTLKREEIEPGVHGLFEKPEYGFYMVAESEGKVVGSLMITFEWSDWRNGLFWWIQSVYVIPEFRRKGVYRTMYLTIKTLAEEKPDVCGFRLYVERENINAQKTYASLGMDETHYKMFEEIK
ncbi:GNAT family N-acetyltransferase [Rhodohalobacter barkolensis]|uniref:GNAT family N-acetyltransferase n=1 Tax=Rhodohalobacter barkolensis TaxID=2053187 RepID=A0A2N0VGN2_9BACT|nr:GNAT family N-acetyltransferase [Rhodohalobacter barkolensis]PKD43362.1 GNAT family N-acetyltransferase [Rhodohalobacter barkolensis]